METAILNPSLGGETLTAGSGTSPPYLFIRPRGKNRPQDLALTQKNTNLALTLMTKIGAMETESERIAKLDMALITQQDVCGSGGIIGRLPERLYTPTRTDHITLISCQDRKSVV